MLEDSQKQELLVDFSLLEDMPYPVCIMDASGGLVIENKMMRLAINHPVLLQRMSDAFFSFIAPEAIRKDDFCIYSYCQNESLFYVVMLTGRNTSIEMHELELKARTDGLTRLANKIAFKDALDRGVISAKSGSHLSLIFIDMDGFKKINDIHGHIAGDMALIDFSKEIKKACRKTDLICRVGGDEFAIILEAPFEVAKSIAEKLEHRYCFSFEGKSLEYGCSAGVVAYSSGHDVDSLLSQADAMMYARKNIKKTLNNAITHNRYAGITLSEKLRLSMPFPLSEEFIKTHVIDNIEHTEIRLSGLHGYGLFAMQDMPRETSICKLTGQLMSKDVYQALVQSLTPKLGDLSFYFLMECNHVPNPNMLMVRSFRTKWSYVNHSTEPNCFFDIFAQELYPLRDIKKGEELTFDYRVEPLSQDYIDRNKLWLEE